MVGAQAEPANPRGPGDKKSTGPYGLTPGPVHRENDWARITRQRLARSGLDRPGVSHIPADRWDALPRGVQNRIRGAAALDARARRLAGPVTVTRAIRCDCGSWMRPGVDHECAGDAIG
jgi:hypothetical protein